MTVIKTSMREISSDNPNSPFWKAISSTPAFNQFEKDLDIIMKISLKYRKPYNELTSEELKNENR